MRLLVAALLVLGAAEAPHEYAVKAAFLYNFARFVEWPDDARVSPSFRICIVGDDPFGTALDDAVRGKKVHHRPVEVTHPDSDDLAGCHIVFVPSSEKATVPRLLTGAAAPGVLTVGETDGFTHAGGIIGMRLQDSKVRFDVNLQAAQRAGLRVSSELLKLATEVIQ